MVSHIFAALLLASGADAAYPVYKAVCPLSDAVKDAEINDSVIVIETPAGNTENARSRQKAFLRLFEQCSRLAEDKKYRGEITLYKIPSRNGEKPEKITGSDDLNKKAIYTEIVFCVCKIKDEKNEIKRVDVILQDEQINHTQLWNSLDNKCRHTERLFSGDFFRIKSSNQEYAPNPIPPLHERPGMLSSPEPNQMISRLRERGVVKPWHTRHTDHIPLDRASKKRSVQCVLTSKKGNQINRDKDIERETPDKKQINSINYKNLQRAKKELEIKIKFQEKLKQHREQRKHDLRDDA